MSVLKILNLALNVASSLINDDNGYPYRDDNGGYIPNNEYDLDGIHYETDDNGSIYRANGEYYSEDVFQLDGTWYSTDENGNLEK